MRILFWEIMANYPLIQFVAAVFIIVAPLLQELYKIVKQLSLGQVEAEELSRPSTGWSDRLADNPDSGLPKMD